MRLTTDQVALVRAHVERSGILIESLKADVLDHLCCVVEVKLDRGRSFEEGLKEALKELAPDGLKELENETIFLLNSNKIILMKKLMFTIGALSSMSFVTGWLLGLLHWPGAFELSAYGFLGFGCFFMPLYAIDYFKTDIHRALNEKWKFGLGLLSAVLIGVATFFKIFHLPGANLLLVVGTSVFVIGFLPFLFFGWYKKSVS